MPRLCIVHRALGAGLLLAACGGNERPADDAGCWPLSDPPSAQVGTGDVTFEPMPDVLPVIRNASQSDPYLQVHVRIHGIPPGDPGDTLASGNPKTMGSVVIPDLGRTLGADRPPATIGYTCSPEPGAYDLAHSLHIGFGFGDNSLDQVSGKQARITIEVVGSNGLSARDEKLVTLMVMSGAAPGTGAPITAGGSP